MTRIYFIKLLFITQLFSQVVYEFNYSGSIETWTVPYDGEFTIETYGAQGGGYYTESGGYGAKMPGDFLFSQGEQLKILVGSRGGASQSPGDYDCFCTYSTSGGGGGGTFVVLDDATPLVISGGGISMTGNCLASSMSA